MNNKSFIILISFNYGVGTNKNYHKNLIKDLKDNIIEKGIFNKVNIFESDKGCTEYKIVLRVTFEGLKIILFNYVYPSEVIHTMGSLTLEYGHCDAIAFKGEIADYFLHYDATYLTKCKYFKKKYGKSYTYYEKDYICDCIDAYAGITEIQAYVTPVKEENGEFSIDEDMWNFFESLMKKKDIEKAFNEFFINY